MTVSVVREADGMLTINGCDPEATYPVQGAVLIDFVEQHNAMLTAMAMDDDSLAHAFGLDSAKRPAWWRRALRKLSSV